MSHRSQSEAVKRGRPPGFKGSSNRDIRYQCSVCDKEIEREKLMAKRVQFTTIGKGAKLLRSRITAWVCPDCADADPDWISQPWSSPGYRDVRNAS